MAVAGVDQALVGAVAVEDENGGAIGRDEFADLVAQMPVPGGDVAAEVAVEGQVLDHVAHRVDDADRLRHGGEDRLHVGRQAPCHGEQPGEVAHADSVRGEEERPQPRMADRRRSANACRCRRRGRGRCRRADEAVQAPLDRRVAEAFGDEVHPGQRLGMVTGRIVEQGQRRVRRPFRRHADRRLAEQGGQPLVQDAGQPRRHCLDHRVAEGLDPVVAVQVDEEVEASEEVGGRDGAERQYLPVRGIAPEDRLQIRPAAEHANEKAAVVGVCGEDRLALPWPFLRVRAAVTPDDASPPPRPPQGRSPGVAVDDVVPVEGQHRRAFGQGFELRADEGTDRSQRHRPIQHLLGVDPDPGKVVVRPPPGVGRRLVEDEEPPLGPQPEPGERQEPGRERPVHESQPRRHPRAGGDEGQHPAVDQRAQFRVEGMRKAQHRGLDRDEPDTVAGACCPRRLLGHRRCRAARKARIADQDDIEGCFVHANRGVAAVMGRR